MSTKCAISKVSALYVGACLFFVGSGMVTAQVYTSYPTGDYGSIQTNGTGKGSWAGYSINGRYNFMSSSNDTVGIYDDVNNRWRMYWDADDFDLKHKNDEVAMHADQNNLTRLYYDNISRMNTTNTGVAVSGELRTTGTTTAANYCDENGNNCINPAGSATIQTVSQTTCAGSFTQGGDGVFRTPVLTCPAGYVRVGCTGWQDAQKSEIHEITAAGGGCRGGLRPDFFGNFAGACFYLDTICLKSQ